MIYIILVLLGLCAGSFVNALVYRIHEQEKPQKKRPKEDLSILKGRSICPHCHHLLAWQDLIPVFSWLILRGRCRYCHKTISWQYPIVELLTAVLFIISYTNWPMSWGTAGTVNFILWLIMLAGFMALIVYDLRWMLLPNRIIYPLIALALGLALYNIFALEGLHTLYQTVFSVSIASGIFYLLFIISKGRWIGGGDVKLGLLIGLLLQDAFQAFSMLLIASLLGTAFIIPGILMKKVTPKSRIPFGPFLIVSAIIVKLFSASIIAWYEHSLLIGG